MTTQAVPAIYIYIQQLPGEYINEMRLWQNVELRFFEHIPMQRDNSGTDSTIHKLLALEQTCMTHGNCIFMDASLASIRNRTAFDAIAEELVLRHHVFASEDFISDIDDTEAIELPYYPVIGFLYPSEAFEAHVAKKLQCIRRFACDSIPVKITTKALLPLDILGDRSELEDKYFCFIHLRQDTLYQFTPMDSPLAPSNKIRIGLGVPTTSRKQNHWNESSLLSAFIPSFIQSVNEDEWEKFEFIVYIGFDEFDPFWDTNSTFALLNQTIHEMSQEMVAANVVFFRYIRLPPTQGWLTYIWNHLYARSMFDRAEYFYQLNDDLNFETRGWATAFVQTLQEYNDFGVVAPNDVRWNCEVLTQAFVSRKHWDIFGWFYPPEIKDWYSDFWITKVYGADATHCLQDVKIQNLQDKGTRYNLCNRPKWHEAVVRDTSKVKQWSQAHI